MSTQYAEVFAALAAVFDRDEVGFLPKGGKKFPYVNARVVMNRLDAVLGPENWRDEYTPHEHSVECRLSVRMPGGEWITKADAGAYAGMSDQGDDDKSGYSDAFKRAAVKFGVARYLYGSGIPGYGEVQAPGPEKPETGGTQASNSEDFDLDSHFGKWVTMHARGAGVRRWQVAGKCYREIREAGERDRTEYLPDGLRGVEMWRSVAAVWSRDDWSGVLDQAVHHALEKYRAAMAGA